MGQTSHHILDYIHDNKLFEKVILKIVQKHIEERGLLNAGQFGFRACHHDTAMYEANGPHDPQFQQQNVYGCGVLEHRKSLCHYMALWLVI
jgi:hypothetical protein